MQGVRRALVCTACAGVTACTAIIGLRDSYQIGDGGVDASLDSFATDGTADGTTDGATDGGSGAGFYQSSFFADANVQNVLVQLPFPMRAGDIIVAAVGWEQTATVGDVTEKLSGSSFTPILPATSAGIVSQELFFWRVTTGGSQQLTVDMSATVTYLDVRVAEYRGPTTAGTPVSNGATNQQTIGVSLDAAPSELLVAAGMANQAFVDAAALGFTVRELTGLHNILQDVVFVDAGRVYNATGSLEVPGNVVFQLVSFK